MADEKKAIFSIDLGGNAAEVADDVAASFEEMRKRIAGGEESVKAMSGSLRRLRGNTADVTAAKDQLKAKIEAERAALSAANLQLLKSGVAYDALAAKARKLAIEKEKAAKKKEAEHLARVAGRTAALTNATRLAGGPVASLTAGFGELGKVLGGAGGAMGVLAVGTVAVVAVIGLLAVGIGAAVVALGRFIVEAGNAARSANLLRLATTGTAENAHNLGTQVDAMASKLSTPKAKLNELAAALARNRFSGQAVVDTFEAVSRASDAMGDETGNKLRGFLERNQIMQRFQLNPLELLGTGLNYDDIAKPLAASMRVGIKDARAALFEGRVSLDAGAKALKEAVQKRFGEVNSKKLLDINVQAEKFKERLAALTTGVDLEPLLRGLDRMSSLFDESTVSGAALKQLVTVVGTGLVAGFNLVAPIASQFFKGLVIAGLRLTIAVLKVKKTLVDTFRDSKVLGDIDAVSIALTAGKAVVYGLAGAAVVAAIGLAAMAAPVLAGVAAFTALSLAGHAVYEWVVGKDWGALGKSIVNGMVDGLVSGGEAIEAAVAKLGSIAEDTFKSVLGIHSPSKVFAVFGSQTAEGFAGGVEQGAPRAQSAVNAMAPSAPAGGRAPTRRRGGGGDININVTVVVESGGARGGGNDAAAQLTSPSFRMELVRVFEEAALAAGLLPRAAT